MKNDDQLEKLADEIADQIVELVERTNGPVKLSDIERQIPGFAKKSPQEHHRPIEPSDAQAIFTWELNVPGSAPGFFWEASVPGVLALLRVTTGHRVAIQYVTKEPYLLDLLDGHCPIHRGWVPIVLLPANAATIVTPNYLFRNSPELQNLQIEYAKAHGFPYRTLSPKPFHFKTDNFALLGTSSRVCP